MTRRPSLRQLGYLVALADKLNFTRAAAACFVTQSTLSVGLKELEHDLGIQLVERDRHSVRLTPAGEVALTRARELLAAADDLVEASAAAARPMSGQLRLGVIPTIAPFLLPTLMPLVRSRFPALRLVLREDLTGNLLLRLRDGALDAALIALPFDTEGLSVQPLFEDELWLVAPQGDALVAGKRVSISAQLSGRLLILEEGHCLREHTLLACGRSEAASADGIEATSLLTLVQMVACGMGVALIPEIALKAGLLAATRLIAAPLAPPVPTRTIALASRRSSARAADLARLAEVIVEEHRRRRGRHTTSVGRRASKAPRRVGP
ncbi:MAG TPA: LysR substrate-binding domain-containing protein [Steroidobacteraceae bacterium]|nr:LysR substrate-binding domain-containing protein [Steroidobacteraceae bacterium]